MSDELHEHDELEDKPEISSIEGVQSTTLMIDGDFLEDIDDLIESSATPALANIIADMHSADIAELINNLAFKNGKFLFEMLPPDTASEVVLDLQETVREWLFEEMPASRISDIVEELDSDDAADIVSGLDEEIAEEVLGQLDPDESAELRALLWYEEDTAGGLMATEFPVVGIDATVQDAVDSVRNAADETSDVYEVFVVDEEGTLRGIVDLKALLLNKPETPISSIYEDDFVSVRTDVDQEDVANVMRKYDLLTLPVVDANNHPVGIITFDDIADVIHEEATEDLQRMSGIIEVGDAKSSIFDMVRGRLPWLLVGFVGEIIAALVLSSFQATIDKILASTFFIPIIMAMGGNAGVQASSVVVRGIATGELAFSRTFSRLIRESASALTSGVALSVLLFVIVFFWTDDVWFGLTVALSLLVVIINATMVGATVPLILNKFGADPALATGPFISTSNDALGLLIYLGFLSLIYLS